MSVKDFPPRPQGTDLNSIDMQIWLDKLRDRQNIDDLLPVATAAPEDETYIFDVSANATRKIALSDFAAIQPGTLLAYLAAHG